MDMNNTQTNNRDGRHPSKQGDETSRPGEPRRQHLGPACSKAGMSASSASATFGAGVETAISRVGSTVSMDSVTISDRREGRMASALLSSSSRTSESEKRPRGRPALNSENVGKFTAKARERRAEKATQLKRDYKIICDYGESIVELRQECQPEGPGIGGGI